MLSFYISPLKIMYSKINSASIHGVNILDVSVEVDISAGLPCFDMVGLLNSEVRESRERVRTAIKNQDINLPPKRITVNLSPVNIRKVGNYFDLPIAIGILSAIGIIYSDMLERILIIGELGLNGEVKKVDGVLTIVAGAKELGYEKCIVPVDNASEGAIVKGIKVYGVSTLNEAVELINKGLPNDAAVECSNIVAKNIENTVGDFEEIYGQEAIKKAAVVAACGMHHMLMVGAPGSGKSMIASRMSTIMPEPDFSECMEITKIYSVAGELQGASFVGKRPFRAPHHTISEAALVGGGKIPKPGEITLAHRGVLFLDELAEYKRDTLDVIRQPLENKKIIINRTSGTYEFPADFMLVSATNPCKCGYYPDRNKCNCSEYQVDNYLGRISGPIMDRIDICVPVYPVSIDLIKEEKKGLSSEEMKRLVEKGRAMQVKRYKSNTIYNSALTSSMVRKYCPMSKDARELLENAYNKFKLSMRAYFKIIKVARTIADINECEVIDNVHMSEAINYRLFK